MKAWLNNSLCAAVVGLMLIAPVQAQNKQVIKLGWTTTDGPQDPYAIGARAFKAALEADPNGQSFDVQFYPNRQLGDEKALLEGVRMGLAESGIITNAVVAQMESAFLLNDLPFLFASEEQAYELMDGSVGEKLAKKLETKGISVVGYMGGGFRNMINNVRPVVTPQDVSGVKYRVMQSPIYIGMYESLGGSPVPMAWGETYTAVQQGALDGLEIPLSVIDSTKSYEITKYLSLTNHTFSVIELVFNKRFLDRLDTEKRQAVLDAARKATLEQRKTSDALARQVAVTLKEKGMEVNEIEDPAAFREKVKPVYERFRKDIGSDLLDEALAQVQ
ncbi:TRAP transporter substrate-binding protein [Alcaligenaceae bacterium]|nr:TRAP transporter substrate-binding protein [Alcaligenaceae bacterium]